jgi:NAD(P)H-dependent flavin oxidoreductase YrpB (nitropropane dioxygenase family)
MAAKKVLRTELCDLLGCDIPIMLAGMGALGRATPPRLVAAVSNAGGFGVMSGSGLEPEAIRARIRKVRELTDRPFGVGLLLPARLDEGGESRSEARARLERDYPKHVAFVRELLARYGLEEPDDLGEFVMSPSTIREQVQVVLDERVPWFEAALGDPAWVVPQARDVGVRVMGIAGSARNAMRQKQAGCELIIAQGYEAGGHTGAVANFPLIPEVVDSVAPIPVVAAGGIVDGRGVAAALCLGAIGVWVGTAFLAAEETEMYEQHVNEILEGETRDFSVSRTYTGKPSRSYRNPIRVAWEESGLNQLPMPLQGILMQPIQVAAQRAGRYELMHNAAGQGGGRVKEKRPAKVILEEMAAEAAEILQRVPANSLAG